MPDLATLLQFLFEGDYFGFIQAVYVSAFQSADLFYGFLGLLFAAGTFIRTKSLMFMSIMWILVGGLILAAMPIVSSVAMLLMIFGVAGLLFKLFLGIRD